MRSAALGLALALCVPAVACKRGDDAAAAKAAQAADKVGSLDVDALDHLITAGDCQVLDANGQPTRERMGVIPGATLLSDFESYKLDELPADKAKKLVFYCSNRL